MLALLIATAIASEKITIEDGVFYNVVKGTNQSIMTISPDGTFTWKGKKVAKDKEIYKHMKQFFSGNHCTCEGPLK